MKVTKHKAAQNRAALVNAAALLFQQRAVGDVSVSEICALAGLTHGALYAHFPSKLALAGEALAQNIKQGYVNAISGEDRDPARVKALLIINELISGITVARGALQDDPDMAVEILQSLKRLLHEVSEAA